MVKELKTPGLGLREMAYKTQGEVAKLASANGYNQVPGIYSQIIGDDVYLTGQPPSKPLVPVVNVEEADFRAAMESGSITQLEFIFVQIPYRVFSG